jgi:hypothetical protein
MVVFGGAEGRRALGQVDDNVPGARDTALYRKLVAMDRQGIVLLGDPTMFPGGLNREGRGERQRRGQRLAEEA